MNQFKKTTILILMIFAVCNQELHAMNRRKNGNDSDQVMRCCLAGIACCLGSSIMLLSQEQTECSETNRCVYNPHCQSVTRGPYGGLQVMDDRRGTYITKKECPQSEEPGTVGFLFLCNRLTNQEKKDLDEWGAILDEYDSERNKTRLEELHHKQTLRNRCREWRAKQKKDQK